MTTSSPLPSTQATSRHVDIVLMRLQEYKLEARVFNMKFYLDALHHNELSPARKDFTLKQSRCDICRDLQAPGIRKLHYKDGRGGWQSFDFQLCGNCWCELIATADVKRLAEVAQ